jgi:cytochrome c-type biogenesis protein CcmH
MRFLRAFCVAIGLMLMAAAGQGLAPALLAPALAQAPQPEATISFSNPALEARARNLQRELRCLVCQGESIDESGSDFAADARRLVRHQIAEGRTDQQIKDYLVARYGVFILMQPPLQPDTYLLWIAPFVVLAGAGGIAFWAIRRARPAGPEPL